MIVRSSEEIIQEILYLATELAEAQKYEKQEQRNRLDYLTNEVEKQRQKQREIVGILLRE